MLLFITLWRYGLWSSQGWLVGLLRRKDGCPVSRDDRVFVTYNETFGSMSASEQLRTNINPHLLSVDCCWVKGGVGAQLPRSVSVYQLLLFKHHVFVILGAIWV